MLPRGFLYLPEFVSHAEELSLVAALHDERFARLRVRGQLTRREIVSYGLEFRPYVSALPPAPPLPSYLHPLRNRAASAAGISSDALVQAILSRYSERSDIGWHIDHRSFGGLVACVSLLGSATLSFRGRRRQERVAVAPRSLYLLQDDARFVFEHKVVAHSLRFSITLRTLAAENGALDSTPQPRIGDASD